MSPSHRTCWVHGVHRPPSLTVVEHHIIPREWQYKWNPDGKHWMMGRVWAEDVIRVCPTGHANIHYHIRSIKVRLVMARFQKADLEDQHIWTTLVDTYQYRTKDSKVARQAFYNWRAAGGPWDVIM